MLLSRTPKELFRQSTTSDLLALFRSLLNSRDIQPQEALALAGAVHAMLRNPQGGDGSVYAQYAQAMALLQHAMPETHEYVVVNWHLTNLKRI